MKILILGLCFGMATAQAFPLESVLIRLEAQKQGVIQSAAQFNVGEVFSETISFEGNGRKYIQATVTTKTLEVTPTQVHYFVSTVSDDQNTKCDVWTDLQTGNHDRVVCNDKEQSTLKFKIPQGATFKPVKFKSKLNAQELDCFNLTFNMNIIKGYIICEAIPGSGVVQSATIASSSRIWIDVSDYNK